MTAVYTYDSMTKEYLYKDICQICPKTGQELMPANSTQNIPPLKEEDKAIVYENGQWVLKPDYRFKEAFNELGVRTEIRFIGDLPEGWSWDPPAN